MNNIYLWLHFIWRLATLNDELSHWKTFIDGFINESHSFLRHSESLSCCILCDVLPFFLFSYIWLIFLFQRTLPIMGLKFTTSKLPKPKEKHWKTFEMLPVSKTKKTQILALNICIHICRFLSGLYKCCCKKCLCYSSSFVGLHSVICAIKTESHTVKDRLWLKDI